MGTKMIMRALSFFMAFTRRQSRGCSHITTLTSGEGGGVSNGVKFDPREALTFDKLFDRLLSMKRGKNVGIPKCVGPYHEIIPTQKEMPKMTFDDKAGIGLGWQTMSEKDGEILIVNGM